MIRSEFVIDETIKRLPSLARSRADLQKLCAKLGPDIVEVGIGKYVAGVVEILARLPIHTSEERWPW